VIAHLNRYTFSERTGLADMTGGTCQLALSGPLAAEALGIVGCARPAKYHALTTTFEGHPLHVLGHDGLTGDGFSFVMELEHGGSLWQALVLAVSRLDGRPAGEQAVEAARILRGIPAPGRELTGDYNPLEAGLWHAVSFDKGCYVGQEVIARLNTYDKLARTLAGLELAPGSDPPPPGTALLRDGQPVGTVTSSAVPPGWERPVALGYVKRRLAEPRSTLTLGRPGAAQAVRVVELPFEA
jgi:folate-binding protein YgfZ